MRFFQIDSPFMRFMTRIADLIILNLLWLVCCAPILTIGPATTALYHVTLHMLDGTEGSSITKEFFHAFSSNFKCSLAIWLVLLLPYAAVVLGAILVTAQLYQGPAWILYLCPFPLLFLLLTGSYVFAYAARYENSPGMCIKNAFLISMMYLPKSLVILFLDLIAPLLLLLSPALFLKTSLFWFLIGFSLTALITSPIMRSIFSKLEATQDAQGKQ